MTQPPKRLFCSFCRTPMPFDGARITLDMVVESSIVRPVGAYCSTDCRDKTEVVDAVRELQRNDEVADLLLALWRRGCGPQPAIVAEAVRRASRQKAAVASTA